MSGKALGDAYDHSPFDAPALFVVHLSIADVVNDVHDYRFWMRREQLAEKARVSRGTVDTALRGLVEAGWLEILDGGGGRGKATEYRYNLTGKPRSDCAVTDDTAQPVADTAQSAGIHPLTNERERKAPASSRRKPKVPIPDPFVVTDEMRAWVAREYPTLDWDAATREWVSAAKRDDWRFANWEQGWRNGMHKAARWHKPEVARTHL